MTSYPVKYIYIVRTSTPPLLVINQDLTTLRREVKHVLVAQHRQQQITQQLLDDQLNVLAETIARKRYDLTHPDTVRTSGSPQAERAKAYRERKKACLVKPSATATIGELKAYNKERLKHTLQEKRALKVKTK